MTYTSRLYWYASALGHPKKEYRQDQWDVADIIEDYAREKGVPKNRVTVTNAGG